jgi:hypothetical protein
MAKCKAFESLVFTCCNCGNNQAQEEDELHCFATPEAGVLDEPYSAKPAQRSSHTGPPDAGVLFRKLSQLIPLS